MKNINPLFKILGITIVIVAFKLNSIFSLDGSAQAAVMVYDTIFTAIFSVIYLVILFVIGNIASRSDKQKSKMIHRAALISIIPLALLIILDIATFNRRLKKVEIIQNRIFQQYINRDSILLQRQFDSLTIILQSDTNNFEALMKRGLIYKSKEEWDNAFKDFTNAYKLKSDNFDVNMEMGVYYGVFKNDFSVRDSFYRKAAQLEPNSYFAKNNPWYLHPKK